MHVVIVELNADVQKSFIFNNNKAKTLRNFSETFGIKVDKGNKERKFRVGLYMQK